MTSMRIPGKRTSAARLLGLATTVVLGSALLAPAAHADGKGAPLTVAVGDVTHNQLTRGSGTNTFTVTVTNTTGSAQPFTGDAMVGPGTSGPSPLAADQVRLEVTPLKAPATDLSVQGQNPGLNTLFFPHGGTAATGFSIPAGATYTWKVAVGAAADFPGNDDGLDIDVRASLGEVVASADVHFDIAPALPDGNLTGKFDHAATVAPGSPGSTSLTLDDEAGGTFTSPLSVMVDLNAAVPGLGLEYRSGGTWVKAKAVQPGQSWLLPQVPAGFAYRQTHTYALRFTIAQQPAAPRDQVVHSRVVLGGTIASAQTVLHLKQATAPATNPASKPARTSAKKPASASASAAHTTTTGSDDTADTADTAQLASTGASQAGLRAGLGGLLVVVGGSLLFWVARQRRA